MVLAPSCFGSDGFGQFGWSIGLPDIRVEDLTNYAGKSQREQQAARQETTKAHASLRGPMSLIPGELISCVYPSAWVIAHAENDQSKPVNKDYLASTAFEFVSGDAMRSVVVKLGTGQKAVIRRPADVNAPSCALISLTRIDKIAGLPKHIVRNRLAAPTTIETIADGREVWRFHKEIRQSSSRVLSTSGQVNGFVGGDMVNLNTSQQSVVRVSRSIVLWDFSIVFSANGLAESFSNGSTGAGQWVAEP